MSKNVRLITIRSLQSVATNWLIDFSTNDKQEKSFHPLTSNDVTGSEPSKYDRSKLISN